MAIFDVTLEYEPAVNNGSSAHGNSAQKVSDLRVRRPLMGMEQTRDEPRYSYLQILDSNNQAVPLLDSSWPTSRSQVGRKYANFVIQNVSRSKTEKAQLMPTFGQNYVFFFGEQPKTITFRGLLTNTADFDWKQEFWQNYDENLRGSQLVSKGYLAYVYYDGLLVGGYLLGCSMSENVATPNEVPFEFSMVVVTETWLTEVQSAQTRYTQVVDANIVARKEASTITGSIANQTGGWTVAGIKVPYIGVSDVIKVANMTDAMIQMGRGGRDFDEDSIGVGDWLNATALYSGTALGILFGGNSLRGFLGESKAAASSTMFSGDIAAQSYSHELLYDSSSSLADVDDRSMAALKKLEEGFAKEYGFLLLNKLVGMAIHYAVEELASSVIVTVPGENGQAHKKLNQVTYDDLLGTTFFKLF